MDAKKMKNNYTYSRYVYINIIYIYIYIRSSYTYQYNSRPPGPLIRPPANRPKIAGGANRSTARAPPSAGSQTDAAAGKALYQPVAPSSTTACSEGGPSTGSPLSGTQWGAARTPQGAGSQEAQRRAAHRHFGQQVQNQVRHLVAFLEGS